MNKIIIKETLDLVRVDVFIHQNFEDLSRNKIKKLITEGFIKVNDDMIKPSYILKIDDVLTVTIPKEEKEIKKINLNLEIVYEDTELLVIYKPANLIVHPSASTEEATLVNHLLYHADNLSLKGGFERAGIVHRLDKETSGLLVVAKTDTAYDSLVSQFKNRTVTRKYLTIVNYPFNEDSGTINAPILRDKVKMIVDKNGKEAITHFKVLNQNENYSYLECSLETGRTHQIRVHLAYIKHPVVGDTMYGLKKDFKNYSHLLHAYKLEFIHPITKKLLSFQKEPPKEFLEVLKKVNLA